MTDDWEIDEDHPEAEPGEDYLDGHDPSRWAGDLLAVRLYIRCGACGHRVGRIQEHEKGLAFKAHREPWSDEQPTWYCPTHRVLQTPNIGLVLKRVSDARKAGRPATLSALPLAPGRTRS